MANKILVVTKPNLMLKVGKGSERKMVKLDIGTEFECDEKEADILVRKGRVLVVTNEDDKSEPKVTPKPKTKTKETKETKVKK